MTSAAGEGSLGLEPSTAAALELFTYRALWPHFQLVLRVPLSSPDAASCLKTESVAAGRHHALMWAPKNRLCVLFWASKLIKATKCLQIANNRTTK